MNAEISLFVTYVKSIIYLLFIICLTVPLISLFKKPWINKLLNNFAFFFISNQWKPAPSRKITLEQQRNCLCSFFIKLTLKKPFAGWVVTSLMFIMWFKAKTLSYVVSKDAFWLHSYGHVSVIYNIPSNDIPSCGWHIETYVYMLY